MKNLSVVAANIEKSISRIRYFPRCCTPPPHGRLESFGTPPEIIRLPPNLKMATPLPGVSSLA